MGEIVASSGIDWKATLLTVNRGNVLLPSLLCLGVCVATFLSLTLLGTWLLWSMALMPVAAVVVFAFVC